MSPRILEITIFNESYKIVSSYDDYDRILRIAKLLDNRMFMLSKKFPKYSSSRIAVLTSLNLLDEILKLQFDRDKVIDQVKKINNFISCSHPDLFS